MHIKTWPFNKAFSNDYSKYYLNNISGKKLDYYSAEKSFYKRGYEIAWVHVTYENLSTFRVSSEKIFLPKFRRIVCVETATCTSFISETITFILGTKIPNVIYKCNVFYFEKTTGLINRCFHWLRFQARHVEDHCKGTNSGGGKFGNHLKMIKNNASIQKR